MSRRPDGNRPAHARSDRRALLVLVALAATPWSVQVYADEATLLYPWGLVGVAPLHVTTILDFLFRYTMGLPRFVLAWPVSVVCYLFALASAAVGAATGREDVRVTAGLLVLAGLAQLSLAAGFSRQPTRVAVPAGTLSLWALAWGLYWPRIRARAHNRD